MNYARLSNRKRMIVPGLIGAGVSALTSIVGSEIQKNQQKKAQQAMVNQMFTEQSALDSIALSQYDTNGNYVEYYAKGGKLPNSKKLPTTGKYDTIGGKLVPLSSDAVEVKGNTHGEKTIDNSYGVTLVNSATAKPEAEVEDEEVITDDNYVFSNRLMADNNSSFAKRMKQLATKKSKVEEKLENSTDTKDRNGYERQLASFNMAEEVLMLEQELAKAKEGKEVLNALPTNAPTEPSVNPESMENPVLAYGGNFGLDRRKPKGLTLSRVRKDAPISSDSYSDLINSEPSKEFVQGNRNPKYGPLYEAPSKPVEEEKLFPTTTYNPSVADNKAALDRGTSITDNKAVLDRGTFVDDDVKPKTTMDYLSSSLIDNVGNLALTATSPKLSKPMLPKFRPIETTVNINPQLAELSRTTNATVDNILDNTSNSNIARANVASARLNSVMAKNNLLGQKENLERQARNENTKGMEAKDNTYAQMANDYNEKEFIRSNDIQSRLSANFADLGKNIKDANTSMEMDKYNEEQMLLELLDDKTGDKMRVMSRNPYFARSPRLKRAIEAERKRLNR